MEVKRVGAFHLNTWCRDCQPEQTSGGLYSAHCESSSKLCFENLRVIEREWDSEGVG